MENVYVDLRNENRWIREEFSNKDMVSVEDLLTKVENLRENIDALREEYEDFKREVEDNYEPIEYKEQI